MNLYVLFAIALGAISGFSEPSVAPRAFARVVDVRGARAGRQQIAAARIALTRTVAARCVPQQPALSFAHVEVPLTGSASPRAPALNR